MITGKFHSHITISPTDKETAQAMARSVHGKITFIDLGPGHTDYMITHHYVTGFHGLNSALDVETLLRRHAEDLPGVLRLKLEHEIMDPRTDPSCIEESITRGVYTEIHLRMNSPHVESGWSTSSNALNGSHF